ncbi:MAG TPA: hypothetical protein VMV81_05285 [Phycisphaerae bacterium]|nr:hypothetical protein [Phycisphaerae bacterium]
MTAQSTTSDRVTKGHPLSGGLGIFVFVVVFGAAAYLTYRTLTTAPMPTSVGLPSMFVCSESGKPFEYTLKNGEDTPVMSPFSNKKTGYPAESCYWTKDGKRKSKPTYVILNSRLGKTGDTICPDCGRPVTDHNPLPPASTPMAKE